MNGPVGIVCAGMLALSWMSIYDPNAQMKVWQIIFIMIGVCGLGYLLGEAAE